MTRAMPDQFRDDVGYRSLHHLGTDQAWHVSSRYHCHPHKDVLIANGICQLLASAVSDEYGSGRSVGWIGLGRVQNVTTWNWLGWCRGEY